MQGHSIIAAMAERRLKANHPEAFAKITRMLAGVQSHFPETQFSLLEAAVMPDLLNFQFGGFEMKAHFINMPIVYAKDKEAEVNIPTPLESENVITGLARAVAVIQRSLDPKYSPTIPRGFMDSIMLRYFLHLVGDIHQPLHTVAFFAKDLFDGKIKNGDQGGNLIPIHDIFGKGETNLHSLYDNAFNSFEYGKLDFPYSADLNDQIHSQARYLEKLYPEEHFGDLLNVLDVNQWAQEGFEIAENFIYSQVELFPMMSPEYALLGKKICQERMALAGYRLFRLLKMIFLDGVKLDGNLVWVRPKKTNQRKDLI